MTNFRDAFNMGLAAHADAERATKEIVSVFNVLAQQVDEATDGKLTVQRANSFRTLLAGRTIFDAITGVMAPREPYTCLQAILKTKSGEHMEICTYKLAPDGYPVSIHYEEHSEDAFDKSSLESVLDSLLRHPATGRKFQFLLDKWKKEEPPIQEQHGEPNPPSTPSDPSGGG
jgi:hypothetical protein